MYKKAMKSQDKGKTKVVVARKGRNNMRRPRGVKGNFKVVDPRMKKDKRAAESKIKTKGRGKKGAPTKKPAKRLAKKPMLAD